MPPSAAPEWLRTGWIFETIATSTPASKASIAEGIPPQPPLPTRTSRLAPTTLDATTTASPARRATEASAQRRVGLPRRLAAEAAEELDGLEVELDLTDQLVHGWELRGER